MVGRIAAKAAAGGARPLEPKPILHDADASVTHGEVCGCHGVGRLVEMLFDGEPIILSVRFSNLNGAGRSSAASTYAWRMRTSAGTPCAIRG